jgi:hypothetical protein
MQDIAVQQDDFQVGTACHYRHVDCFWDTYGLSPLSKVEKVKAKETNYSAEDQLKGNRFSFDSRVKSPQVNQRGKIRFNLNRLIDY